MIKIVKTAADIKAQLAEIEKKYNRPSGSVTLIGTTKKQPIPTVRNAAKDGLVHFGETNLDEALGKIAHTKNSGLQWHFLAPLKQHKPEVVARFFDWIHLDCAKSAIKLSEARTEDLPPLNLLIKVKTEDGAYYNGIELEELLMAADFIERRLPRVKLRGLSATPASNLGFKEQREFCKRLKIALDGLKENGHPQLDTLCIGTPLDFEAAVAEGATIVTAPIGKYGAEYFEDYYTRLEKAEKKNDYHSRYHSKKRHYFSD